MGRALRRTLIGVFVLAAIAIAVPFLVPISHFIPELARIASEKLGQPVAIGELQLHVVPRPRVVATGITVGKKSQITIGELEIVPELLSFVSGARSVRLIRATRVEVQQAALAIPRTMPKGEKGTPVHVRRIVLLDVTFHHSSLKLPQFDVDVKLAEGLRVARARFESRDGSLQLLVEPKGNATTAVALAAKNWTLPAGAPLMFEALAVQGMLKAGELDLPKIEGELYGGKLIGAVRAEWGKQMQLSGKASLAGVDLVPLQQALGKPAKLSGRLKADASFSMRAKTAAELRDALALDGPFEVVGGAYQGVDLSKAGDPGGQPSAGDATTFEELKGTLQVRGNEVKVNELCVRSPKVVAGGHVEIAADQTLAGKLNVSVSKTGGFVGVPVSLGGTTAAPSVTPTKGYMIGAAIGTLVMPVIGTTLGSALGSRIEGKNSSCN
jgi:uncharacterized protein involved in outer membrane biogenesis